MNFKQQFNSATGYYQLGMFEDAWRELQSISAEHRQAPEVWALKITVLMQLRKWEEAIVCGTELLKLNSDEPAAYIDIAYCLHELKRTEQAREILLGAVNLLQDNATFHYNMACYESCLGNLDTAKSYLQRSIEMNDSFSELSETDPDLKPLRK